MSQDRLTEQDLLDILEAAEKRPYFKWLMARKVMNMPVKEMDELEKKFGRIFEGTSVDSLNAQFELDRLATANVPQSKIEGNTVSVKPKDDFLSDVFSEYGVDDTREFRLVRCPKCELMVEELVATPYRHVCASCAKGE